MAWESLREDQKIPDPKAGYKAAARIEQYRVSNEALFLPRQQYIPLSAIEKIQVRKAFMPAGKCCGMGIPVPQVIVFYGGVRPARLVMDRENNANRLAEQLTAYRGEILWEEYPVQGAIL